MIRSEYTANALLSTPRIAVPSWMKPSTCNRRAPTLTQRVIAQMIVNARNGK